MTNWLKWLLAGLAVYLVLLVATLPANQLTGRLTLPPDISLYGVSGTVWNGAAESVTVDGLTINKVEWQLSFFPLLWGQVSADLDAGDSRDSDQISVKGPVTLSLLNPAKIATEELVAFAPADLLMDQLPLPFPIQAEGRIRLNLTEMDFDQQCEVLSGEGQWLNARVPGTQGLIDLGNFSAALGCQEGAVVVTVSEPNAFGLSAVVRVPNDLAFSIDGQFKPDPSLPRDVHTAARFFGQPDAQGYYTIDF